VQNCCNNTETNLYRPLFRTENYNNPQIPAQLGTGGGFLYYLPGEKVVLQLLNSKPRDLVALSMAARWQVNL
jgi:hypothetical protein